MPEVSRTYYPVCRAILQVVFDGFGPTSRDTPPKIIPIHPRRATVHKNSYSQADSWSIEFDALDLPIDPELVRAGSIEIFMFQVPGMRDDQRIVSRQTNALAASSGERTRPGAARTALQAAAEASRAAILDLVAIEQRRADAIEKFTFSNPPLVAGTFDEHSLELSGSGHTVRISGQDYTEFLIGGKWPTKKNGQTRRIPVGKRLDLLLQQIIRQADTSKRLNLELRGVNKGVLPIVGGREVRGHKRGIPVAQDATYWDVLTKLARRNGFILFVDGLSVVLSRPKNISAKDTSQVRKFAWGENLESLNLRRKLGVQKVPQIIVQGYDDKGRKPIEAKFPVKGDEVPTGIGVKREEHIRIPAYGVTDPRVLKEMAESMFHRLGRAERTVSFATKDLTDMREDDLLNLSAGDAISIQFDTDSFRSVIRNPNIPPDAKVSYLVNRGYGEAIARTIAEHHQKLDALSRPLRIREASYEYDTDSGISIEGEAIDFIVIGGDRLSMGDTIRKGVRGGSV
jgi:hypothetical protein